MPLVSSAGLVHVMAAVSVQHQPLPFLIAVEICVPLRRDLLRAEPSRLINIKEHRHCLNKCEVETDNLRVTRV